MDTHLRRSVALYEDTRGHWTAMPALDKVKEIRNTCIISKLVQLSAKPHNVCAKFLKQRQKNLFFCQTTSTWGHGS